MFNLRYHILPFSGRVVLIPGGGGEGVEEQCGGALQRLGRGAGRGADLSSDPPGCQVPGNPAIIQLCKQQGCGSGSV